MVTPLVDSTSNPERFSYKTEKQEKQTELSA